VFATGRSRKQHRTWHCGYSWWISESASEHISAHIVCFVVSLINERHVCRTLSGAATNLKVEKHVWCELLEKRNCVLPLHFFGFTVRLVILGSALVMVCALWSVYCFCCLPSHLPACALWSQHHWVTLRPAWTPGYLCAPTFIIAWARRAQWVEKQQTRNWPNCTDHHDSAHQNE